ncbi:MAG: homocysteine S-methyltransferase family protein [Candidatus Eiseniibacteriota bacterium]|nr:MAG: homocysteine S-methyltransferase family protein [Candidatus Eisenbacteria bacterium]
MERTSWIHELTKIEGRPVIFDGAMGSLLMAGGLKPGAVPDMLCVEKPELVKGAHKSYVDAGADVIHTNTFGSNRIRLSQAGGSKDVPLLNRAAAKLAREVIEASGESRTRALAAGDVGPSGKLLKPLGELSPEEAHEAFLEQVQSLAEARVDFISIETMFSLKEALLALEAAKDACSLPVSVSMTYEKRKNGFFTVMGETPRSCVEALSAGGADMVGANCTLASADMRELALELVAASQLPVLIEPNAGQPVARGGSVEYLEDPAFFAANVAPLASEGVTAMGGCCGTTPEHIRELRRVVTGK